MLRYPLAHKDGIVDSDYLLRSGDASYREGRRVVVTIETIKQCLVSVEELARGLEADAVDGSIGSQ